MRIFLVQDRLSCSLLFGLLFLTGCGQSADTSSPIAMAGSEEWKPLAVGDSSFVRADPSLMRVSGASHPGAGAAGVGAPYMPPNLSQEILEPGSEFDFGSTFRALPDQRLLRLNYGLHIVDIREPNAPRVEGKLALDDSNVSMHVAGDRLIVLSNAKEYSGQRTDVEYAWGAQITSIDISDRANPKVSSRVSARGWLVSGVLKDHGTDPLTMYVALSATEPYGGKGHGTGVTQLVSFSIARDSGEISLRTEHELPDLKALQLQAQGNHLIAFGEQAEPGGADSSGRQFFLDAHAFDVSSVDGALRPLGKLRLAGGKVADRHALDVRGAVLRVISSGWLGNKDFAPVGAMTQHYVETFDLAEGRQLARIGQCSFQGTNQVDRSVFVSTGAVIVGLMNAGSNLFEQDVRAIAIDEQGQCRDLGSPQLQKLPRVVRKTHDGSRLLTVSEYREPNAQMYMPQWHIQLYDVTDLIGVKLLAETHVGLNTRNYADPESWNIFEAATQVASADGTMETGLMLLAPSESDAGRTAQLLTFSDHTLTSRGSVALEWSESAVIVDGSTAAAVMTWGLDLKLWEFAAAQPPAQLGALTSPPSTAYLSIFDLGDYRLRVTALDERRAQLQLQVTQPQLEPSPLLSSLDLPEALGGEVEHNGDFVLHLWKMGSGDTAQSNLTVYDYSDPQQPRKRGELTTAVSDERIDTQFAVGPISVFPAATPRRQDLGIAKYCTTFPPIASAGDKDQPTFYWGERRCITHASGKEDCTGSLLLCQRDTNACTSLTTDPPGSRTECTEQAESRTWSSTTVRPLDLRDPDAPRFLPPIAMPDNSHANGNFVEGRTLYVNWYVPEGDPLEPSPLIREFVSVVDLTNPDAVEVSDPINVPGPVVAVHAGSLITQGFDPASAGITLARIRVDKGTARLERSLNLPAGALERVVRDQAGNLIVVTTPTDARSRALGVDEIVTLFVIDPQQLSVLGSMPVDGGARWVGAVKDRAAFQVQGGALIVDYSNPTAPFAYSYLPGLRAVHFDGDFVYGSGGDLVRDATKRQHIKQ